MKKVAAFTLLGLFIFLGIAYILGSIGHGNFLFDKNIIGDIVKIDHQNIRVLEAGEGQDILLIHGTPGSIEDVKQLFDSLSKNHHVIAYDRPGHGYSSANDITRNLAYHANFAKAIINHYNLDSTTVIGHSYGGMIAMQLAVEGNDRINQCVILGSPLFNFKSETIYELFNIPILKTSLSWLVSGWYSKNKIGKELPKRFGNNQHLVSAEFVAYRKNLWSQPKVILSKSIETINASNDLHKISVNYHQLKNDVYIFMGMDDVEHYITDLQANMPIPRARVKYYDNCGHFVQIEKIEQLLHDLKAIGI